jgi:hypothetical protein
MTPSLLPGPGIALAMLAALHGGVAAATESAPAATLQCTTEPSTRVRGPDAEATDLAVQAALNQRTMGAAEKPSIEIENVVPVLADRQVLIDIPMPRASGVMLRQQDREVLLSSPQALPPIDVRALQDCAANLIEAISVGYDTLLLSLAPGVTVTRTNVQGGLHLVLQHAAMPAREAGQLAAAVSGASDEPHADERLGEAPSANDQGGLRLRLLEAQLLLQTGQLGEAHQRYEALRQDMPASPDPLNGLASLALRSGRWRDAKALYQEALLLDPGEPGAAAAVRAIERATAPRLRSEVEYRETEGGVGTGRATAVIGGVSGQQPVGQGWRLGFAADFAQVDASQVSKRNGTVGSFSGQRQRAEVYVQHDSVGGQVIVGSLFLNGDTPGLGLRAELPDAWGATTLRAEYHRPNWDFFQSLIDYGTRDRLAVGRRQQLTTDLTGRLEVGGNRYGIQGDREVADTISLSGELQLGSLAGIRGLSTAYVLDSEYLLRRTDRIGADGQRFAPLQVFEREVHALTLGYAGGWKDSTRERALTYELSAGYGVDRYGKAGPLVAGNLGYVLGTLEVRLRGSYVENIGRSRGATTVLGGSLTWVF